MTANRYVTEAAQAAMAAENQPVAAHAATTSKLNETPAKERGFPYPPVFRYCFRNHGRPNNLEPGKPHHHGRGPWSSLEFLESLGSRYLCRSRPLFWRHVVLALTPHPGSRRYGHPGYHLP